MTHTRSHVLRRPLAVILLLVGATTVMAVTTPAHAGHRQGRSNWSFRFGWKAPRHQTPTIEWSAPRGRVTYGYGWSSGYGRSNRYATCDTGYRPKPYRRGNRIGRRDGWDLGYEHGLAGREFCSTPPFVPQGSKQFRRGYSHGYVEAFNDAYRHGKKERRFSRGHDGGRRGNRNRRSRR